MPLPIPILFSSPRFVIVNKPPGLLSVPGKGEHKQDCVISRVRARCPAASGPMVVHRLDMETSGLLVVALDADAQRDLSAQFENRRVEKTYIALLAGLLETDHGEISLPMRADIENRPVQIIDHVHGRVALTRWRILTRETDRTRVEFTPITGRSHQLRLHASAGLHHPILGDPLYGDAASAPRLMLHAARLSFLEPGTQTRVEFQSTPEF